MNKEKLIKVLSLLALALGISMIILTIEGKLEFNLTLVLALFCASIAVLFSFSSPKFLRRVVPGWSFVESRMWNSKFFRWVLSWVVGQDKFKLHEDEFLRSRK